MRRIVAVLAVALGVGIVVGAVGSRMLSAQQAPVKRTVLLKTALAGIEGKEGIVYVAEFAPGAAAGRHTHPGDELIYVLEGSVSLLPEGKPPVALKAGEASHNPTRQVHDARNASATSPAKLLIFMISDKDQPLATPAK